MLVFVFHCPITRPYAKIFSTGYAGVSFFFLLSGFILMYVYRAHFENGLQRIHLKDFYRARIARCYPLHVACLLITLMLLLLFGSPNWTGLYWTGIAPAAHLEAITAQLLLIQSWFPALGINLGVNGPAWSISDEAFFYALFPLLTFVLLRWSRNMKTITILSLAGAGWVLVTVALIGYQSPVDGWPIYILPAARLFDFVQGMLVGIAFIRAERRSWPYPTAVEVAALGLLVVVAAGSLFLPRSLQFSAAFMPFLGAIVFLFACQAGAISRLLSAAAFVRLGEISFAFYLVHMSILLTYGSVFGWTHPIIDFVVSLSMTLGAAYVLYTLIEKPLREHIRGSLKPRPGVLQIVPAESCRALGAQAAGSR